MFISNSNEPVKVTYLQKITSKSMLNGALAIEMINNSFSGSKKKIGHLTKLRTFWSKKNKDMGSEKCISTRYC